MSSTTAAATVAEPLQKPPRKFPPPCWTQEETLSLIQAYRERWYSLRRSYLRTPDWDDVAAAVASCCTGASPAKTSAQCRHKMEKLRQRYRAEKQRALSCPSPTGRYFSSWFCFESMEAMENGTTPPASVQKQMENSSDHGSRLKSFLDQSILKLKVKAGNSTESDFGFDKFVNNFEEDVDKEEEDILPPEDFINLTRRKHPISVSSQPSLNPKSTRSGVFLRNIDEMLPPATAKLNPLISADKSRTDSPAYVIQSANSNQIPDSRSKIKRPLKEIAVSIKLLSQVLMKMERTKMEMVREMEARRIEMEMKRSELVLESQKQIMDVFLEGLFEFKKRKKIKTGQS